MKKGEKPMSDIRNLLTAKDYSLIDKYREIYASDEQCYHIGDNMIPSLIYSLLGLKQRVNF